MNNSPKLSQASIVQSFNVRTIIDAFGGKQFGEVGSYQYISAVATVLIDPLHPANSKIVDLLRAPRRPDGRVEYLVDVGILRPKDPTRARRVLIYDVLNRGRRTSHATYLNEGDAPDKRNGDGRGFLMQQGYTIVWSGWQGDISLLEKSKSLLLGTSFPIASQENGQSLTGQSREEIIFDSQVPVSEFKLSYPTANYSNASNLLKVKQRQKDPWRVVNSWKWKDENTIEIERPKDVDAGAIFEFTYIARDPVVMGLGFASVRDIVSFLQYERADSQGQINPVADLRGGICLNQTVCNKEFSANFEVSIAVGVSQAARFIRDFIWQDFNKDGQGRKVFNGAMPLVAGSRKAWINERFAQPGRWSREHEDHLQVGDQFPFAYSSIEDPISGKYDGIFQTCNLSKTCPRLMHIDGSYEFWHGRSSLISNDSAGNSIAFPENVRAYLLSSTSHVYFIPGKYETPEKCLMSANKLQPASVVRALMKNLIDWVSLEIPPPNSIWPQVSDKELVNPFITSEYRLPNLIPFGLSYRPTYNSLSWTDYSAIPPKVFDNKIYQELVPAIDVDGNDLAGIKTPDAAVPVGTNLPWNPRKKGFAEGAACGGYGSSIPFLATKKDRLKLKDSRLSMQERYRNHENFVQLVKQKANSLLQQRLLLKEDLLIWSDWAGKQIQF